jgi:arabinofuranosyltransferase
MSRASRALALAFPLLGLLLVLHIVAFFPMRLDDAFILLRYAENLAGGHGPIFNLGERVEGFTSPAMVGLEALLLLVGVEPLLAMKLLGVLCGLVLLGSTMGLARELSGSPAARAIAGLLVALHTGVAVACVNGLETAPFAAFVSLGLFLHVRARSPRDEALAGLALALSILFRLEGALPLVFVGVSSLWRWRQEPDRWRRWFALALPSLVLVVPVYVAKGLWFGTFVPNTLLAKVPRGQYGTRFSSGFDYLAEYGTAHYGYLALLGLWVLAFKADRRFRLLALLATVWLVYIASVGGDWMPHARFLVPLVPIASAATAIALVSLWKLLGEKLQEGALTRARSGLVLLAVVAVLPAGVMQTLEQLDRVLNDTGASLRAREPLGAWLTAKAGQGASVAVYDVGAIAYGSGLRVIDTGGLTDARVARLMHERPGAYLGHLFFPDEGPAQEIAQLVLGDKPSFVVLLVNGEMPLMLKQSAELAAQGISQPVRVAYKQDMGFYGVPSFTEDYEYLCHVPSQYDARVDWVWNYNVFIRKGVTLAERPRPDAEGVTRCF